MKKTYIKPAAEVVEINLKHNVLVGQSLNFQMYQVDEEDIEDYQDYIIKDPKNVW